jgi:putative MATE family efflux protein
MAAINFFKKIRIFMKENYTFSTIYKLAWPAIISHATVMFVSIIDLAFIGRIEAATLAIAAAAISNNVCAAIYYFLEGIRTGTTVLIARFFGANQQSQITKTINLALFLALIISPIVFLIVYLSAPLMFTFAKNESIAKMGNSYLMIRLLGLPFHLVIFAIIGTFRGLKNTFYPFLITLAICSLNIFLNYSFVYDVIKLPFSKINNIATATAMSYFICAIFAFTLLLKSKLTRKYVNLKAKFKSILKTFIKIGTEIGLYAGFVVLSLFIFVFIFTALGPQALAAHQIVFQIFLVTSLPPMGFFVATTILVGKLFGEKSRHYIRRRNLVLPVMKKIWIAGAPIVLSMSIICAIFAKPIAHFFSPTNSFVAKTAANSIYLICAMQLFNSIFLIIRGALIAAKDTLFILIAGSITAYLFFLPMSFFVGIKLGYGVFGGFLIFLIWTIIDTIVFTTRFLIKRRHF